MRISRTGDFHEYVSISHWRIHLSIRCYHIIIIALADGVPLSTAQSHFHIGSTAPNC